MQLRALVSSADSGSNWDLRCHVRERLIEFVGRDYPGYLPRLRLDMPAVGGRLEYPSGDSEREVHR